MIHLNVIYKDKSFLQFTSMDDAFKDAYNNPDAEFLECYVNNLFFKLKKLNPQPFTTVWINIAPDLKTLYNMEEKTGSEWKAVFRQVLGSFEIEPLPLY